ncbi:hypothetical protein GOODEAATRI_019830 [Goodea atripinnis]|uniref:Sushi domain-containing protein n=1 Tax=Goodea atripinnis TaxID=208336 RepID=A0ABV0PFF3_9TELE
MVPVYSYYIQDLLFSSSFPILHVIVVLLNNIVTIIINIVTDVSCPIPPNILNGVITFAVMRQHGYKEKVNYSCNEHYTLEGEAEIQCQNTGNWSSKPVCRGES